MTPEEKDLLESTYKLAKENNSILVSIRRSNRIGNIMRGLYWLAILGFSFGAYYFIQPYLNFLTGITGQSLNNVDTIKNFSQELGGLLK